MDKMKKLIVLAGPFMLSFLPYSIFGESPGASFLKIGVGARALSMGSAFTATADDATAIFWNPAGLRQLDKRQLTAMHTEWISDIRYDHLAYAHPTRQGTFAGSVAYLSQGSLEKRGENRQQQGSFDARDSAVTLSMSRTLSVRSSYGVNLKWIQQRIDDQQASGLALDAGFIQKAGRNVSFGLTVQNMGQRLKFVEEDYRLPLSVTGGISFKLNYALEVGADIRRMVNDKKTSISVGTEYWLMNRVALRGGYLFQTAGPSSSFKRTSESTASRLGQFSGINMGFGLKIANYQMDYAITPSAEFGNTHRLSLTMKF